MTSIRPIPLALAAAALVAALAAGALVGGESHARAAAPQARPNIVVLQTDDQTLESLRVMANVKRLLADQGTSFSNSFVSFSLCCPSRATLLTGQYAHNHGVLGNKPPNGGYTKLDHANTLPVWLQRAGYATALVGKYLNGYGIARPREVPAGWSEWHGSIDPSTYRFNGYTLNENGRLRTYQRYSTDLYADRAAEIVRRRAPSARPFFLWVAFLAPHSGGPRDPDDPRGLPTPAPAARHRDRFASEPLPLPPSFNEADVSDKPEVIRERRLLGPQRIAAVQELYQQRLESLLAVDEAVARIVAALRSTGELDRTLIAFTSDNGFHQGEHRVPTGKVLLYEPSIRVPLILRGPAVPRGRSVTELVANIDLAPTFVAAANAKPGRTMDGRPLQGLLGSRPWTPRDLLLEAGPLDSSSGNYRAIRTTRYVYAEYGNGDRELYDLATDPDQLVSRHDDPALAPVRAELAQRLARLKTCAGATCG